MGIKENFRQAAQELMGGPEAAEPIDSAADTELLTDSADIAPSDFDRGISTPEPTYFAPAAPTRKQPTIIAAGDVLTGDLRCTGDLELYGTLTGNISGSGDLKLCGTLTGDAQGRSAEIHGGRVQGNVSASGRVDVDSESMILGDIHAETLFLNGKIRGNLDVKDMLTMSEKAAVLGKISTGRLSVAEGALFQSEVTIPSVDFNALFETDDKKST